MFTVQQQITNVLVQQQISNVHGSTANHAPMFSKSPMFTIQQHADHQIHVPKYIPGKHCIAICIH